MGLTMCLVPVPAQEAKLPTHPVNEEQLRSYFLVCHTITVNRQLIHEKLEVQRKQLPEWYPQQVWDEIENAIEDIDLPLTTLPTYQKYMSQEDVKFLTHFMATAQGQQLVMAYFEANIRAQHAGATPAEAHRQALTYLGHEDIKEVQRIADELSPAEKRDLAAHSARFQQLQPVLAKIQNEYSQALIDKQTELAKAIAQKHQMEMTEAKRNYDSAHKPSP
jgi:hypothetical protein